MLALLSSRENKAAKKMPSFSEEGEMREHAEGERIVVKTDATPLGQNESNTDPSGMKVYMSAWTNGKVLLST